MSWWGYAPYVPVAQRRAKAARAAQKLAKKGHKVAPVTTAGRTIATTFWGKAWCDNLESYSDFSNRLPRGRTYVRNGSVVDLQIGPGKIEALVSGSHLYRVNIGIQPLPAAQWKGIQTKCQGQIGSLIELLQGRLSQGVMEIVTQRGSGLFPSPKEIKLDCSCPDWAEMCKHVAAVLYGVGNRLDHQPELLFQLRQVDHLELVTAVASTTALVKKSASKKKTIAKEDLAQVFGIELEKSAPVKRPSGKTRPAQPAAPPAARGPRKQAKAKAKTKPAKRAPRRGK
ncbi:MAG: SWIM zinc finger family protein [Acidobacteriaceae bacterium]